MPQQSDAAVGPAQLPVTSRPTIGLLVGNLHLGASRTLWPGVLDAARAQEANLISFPGGAISTGTGTARPRSIAYDLAALGLCDGLVTWSTTMGGALTAEEVADFHRRYLPLPMVSLSQLLPGVPVVAIDSYQGMRGAVEHLTVVHGCRHLAFLRGPESHSYAQERYQAYRDVLQEAGLKFDPALVSSPAPWESGAAAIVELLDERHLRPRRDFEAVVAVSDLMAIATLEELLRREIRVPHDVALVGFNDQPEGRFTTPPLTTVALPFYEQGYTAVELLLAQLAGRPVSEHSVLACRLEVRQSCGCPAQSVALAGVQASTDAGATLPVQPANGRDALRHQLQAALAEETGLPEAEAGRLNELIEALRRDVVEGGKSSFLLKLEDLLRAGVAAGRETSRWQNALSRLRVGVLPLIGPLGQERVEALCGQARVVVAETGQRGQAQRYLAAQRQADGLRELGQRLITAFDLHRLTDVLAEQLPAAGIRSAYLALYLQPSEPSRGARLLLALTEHGRAELGPAGRVLLPPELLPAELLPWWRRYSLVFEPLFVGDEQLGFALVEVGPTDGAVYEVLRGQVSSAIKGAQLFQEAQQARLAAEKADQMKTRLLANVTHELRAPLNIILSHTRAALESPVTYSPAAAQADLQHIQRSAEHQLRVINDLLDLSRAEIDELDLYPELLDPRALLEETFQDMAGRPRQDDSVPSVAWLLQVPERLPMLQADPVRLRQVLLNLLSNAGKFTRAGEIILGAEVAPPHLHLWVSDSGIGIPVGQQERIFEPFVTGEHDDEEMAGIGLGLSITRRLVALHGGTITVDSKPGAGSTFNIYLPLPSLEEPVLPPEMPSQPVLLISDRGQPPPEIAEFCRRQGLKVCSVASVAELDQVLAGGPPAAVAWDLANVPAGDLLVIRRLRNHPRLGHVPVILYGQYSPGSPSKPPGITSFLLKPTAGQALLDAVSVTCPAGEAGSILIVDDEESTRESYRDILSVGLPGYVLRMAADGHEAVVAVAKETPSLVLLDLMMPGMDGFDVLDRLRADRATRRVPVIILSSRSLNQEDVRRLQAHALVTFESKGILSEDEMAAVVRRALSGSDRLQPQTSALVKRAIAYLQQNYARPIARWEVAEAAGTSEDYLTHIFRQELGLTPWDYLNRYRVGQAKELLRSTSDSISSIAARVGLKDQAYFSRLFRKLSGLSPNEYRNEPRD